MSLRQPTGECRENTERDTADLVRYCRHPLRVIIAPGQRQVSRIA